MTPELLPCPFCAGPAKVFDNGDSETPHAWVAGCNICGIWMPPRYALTSEEAAERWNWRVVPPNPIRPMRPTPAPWNQPLFDHMAEAHNLVVLEGEMDDIIAAVDKCRRPTPASE